MVTRPMLQGAGERISTVQTLHGAATYTAPLQAQMQGHVGGIYTVLKVTGFLGCDTARNQPFMGLL